MMRKVLKVDLLVIDLSACKRCIPTGAQLRIAVNLLVPVAVVLGIELRLREILVQTPADAKVHALAVIFHIILTEKGLFSHNILT